MASSYVEHTEPLSMSFGVWTQVGPRNRRSQIPPGEGAVLGGLLMAHCVVWGISGVSGSSGVCGCALSLVQQLVITYQHSRAVQSSTDLYRVAQ